MTPDSYLAAKSHAIYAGPAGFTRYFAEKGFGICCAVDLLPEENIITYRGTVPDQFQNWIQDLLAYPDPHPHAKYGPLHSGSFTGMTEMLEEIVPLLNLDVPTTLTGHSLGGQRAQEAAAIMLSEYQSDPKLLRLVAFAPPAAGFQQLLDFIEPIPIRTAYRNAEGFWGDPVPLLPFTLAPEFDFRHLPTTHVTATPGGWLKDADPILWHNSSLYLAALTKLDADVANGLEAGK
jgi:pimeloyl-ACP methyl ester carboxylesterase